jgi:chloramphenicol O-acetyltransferase
MVATRDLRVFRDCEDPFFNFTAEIDVFALYSFCKTRDLSFSRAVLFYSMMTANEIREFRIRIFKDAGRDDKRKTVPRIVFGKYFDDLNARKMMPISVDANYAIMDGFHVGKFFDRLQEMLNSL